MSEDQDQDIHQPSRFSKHRFALLIFGSITISLCLTVISMMLYVSSGAAQVDLSSPSWQSVQKQAKVNERFEGFEASGPITEKVLEDFKKMYDKQVSQVQNSNAFSGNVLDDETLKIEDPAYNTN